MILRREEIEREEKKYLAPYASRAAESLGREHDLRPDDLRTAFQRDRDRVIHCSAFRKLEFKTQVFVITAGDYHRTRITHTMEVAQIARTLARAFRANVDLTEAIALAHDMGHTPFGHAGEDAMRECMKKHGGFEHNIQGLRIVEQLEERYPNYPGLNLTYEVREGIIKHDTDYDHPEQNERYMPGKMASLEAQICDLSDEIAYNCADLDDALKYDYIDEESLREIPWLFDLFEKAHANSGRAVRDKFVRFRAIGSLYDLHVNDVLTFSEQAIRASGVKSPSDVRAHQGRLASFSPEFKSKIRPLKDFLLNRVYMHPTTVSNAERGKKFVRELFAAYVATPRLMPFKHQKKIETEGLDRVVCDYISGMTDRYLHEQYRALFHPEVFK